MSRPVEVRFIRCGHVVEVTRVARPCPPYLTRIVPIDEDYCHGYGDSPKNYGQVRVLRSTFAFRGMEVDRTGTWARYEEVMK